ncbi:hypothetical protein ElyMa_002501800 [Elysia marginata]|uniref:Uncharacterized protein n=1 Tax=Elysia marginata TaxID=1093978 RepID=A0AAV4GR43_9GAST|nr:hypothetical protein ElyMa_002501800 [Elysia marginata]
MPPVKPHAGVCGSQRRSLRPLPQVLKKTRSSDKSKLEPCKRSEKSVCKALSDTKPVKESKEKSTGSQWMRECDLKTVSKRADDQRCENRGREICKNTPCKLSEETDKDSNQKPFNHERITSDSSESNCISHQSVQNKDEENLLSRCENFLQVPADQPKLLASHSDWESLNPRLENLSFHACTAGGTSSVSLSPESCLDQSYPSLLADLNNPDVFSKLLLGDLPLEMRDYSPSSSLSMSSSAASSVSMSTPDVDLSSLGPRNAAAAKIQESDGRQMHRENAFLDVACTNFDTGKVNGSNFDDLEGYSFLW